ncbi:MAG: hypothetical protein ACAI38_01400 [Myxococcota bacterium]
MTGINIAGLTPDQQRQIQGLDPAVQQIVANSLQHANGTTDYNAQSNSVLSRMFGTASPTDQMAPRLVTRDRQGRAASAAPTGTVTEPPAASVTEAPRIVRNGQTSADPNFVNIHNDTQFINAAGQQVPFSQLRSELQQRHGGDARKVDEELRREHGVVPTVNAQGQPQGFAIHTMRLEPASRDAVGALRSAAANGTVPGGDMAARNALGGLGNIPGMGTMRGMGGGLGLLSMGSAMLGATDGIQFQLRKQMRSVASNFGDYNMLSLINSPGISIESLIYYFMAYMSDKYEDKLREKMEEVVIQEQRERRMQQRRDAAEMVGGILSIGGIFNPVGMAAGMAVKQFGEMVNGVEGALSGGSKSTTVLMQEVQILIQNWKMIMDMTSNVSKTLHEMAMTAVRNIR